MKNYKILIPEININELEEEYLFHFNMFKNYTEVDKIKIIISSLDVTHRRIFILYAEYKSLQKVADIFGVSKTTINNKVKIVQDVIKGDLNKSIEELIIKYKIKC